MSVPANTEIMARYQGLAPAGVTRAVAGAARATGVDFAYLMEQAKVESSFQADARASSSSATGLYQFIDSTWLAMVRAHGADHGMAAEAAAIGPDGKVADAGTRARILSLRADPARSAAMAAELAADNRKTLEDAGLKAGPTELYLAHFLGAGGAVNFLKAMQENPDQSAARLLPAAARANPGVFRAGGQDASLGDIHARFAAKFEAAPAAPDAPRLDASPALPASGFAPRPAAPVSVGFRPDPSMTVQAMILAALTAEDPLRADGPSPI